MGGPSAAGFQGRNRRRRRSRTGTISEINVTPLVDVMLVLLIIFMVAAPLMTVGVPVDLPNTDAAPMNSETEPLVVSVDGEGRIYLQETELQLDEVVPKLQAIKDAKGDARIFVRGDRAIDYGSVMRVMARIQAGGFTNVGLVTVQEDG
ncbi:protein TolR [Notoacmeibacter ruber]|uniref:Protein TolR n=1 Tax=Notoacmeibacter ruber TaxID=2670375 RepID=A0A3L7JGE1_9HYPH|nr:protein TolR [Notoacmeibacter ruber]